MMEDVRYQSWSLVRQLNAMYETVEKICGVRVTLVKHHQEIRPTFNDSTDQQQQLDGLRRQGGLLRQQIQDLIVKLPVRPPQDDHQQPATEALRNFLVSNGGETGGWDGKDHQLFLQWRSRFRNNRQTFVSAVCDTVPGKNPAQVEAHEKWYQNLQRLRREQRQELDEWKRRKRFLDEEERQKAAEEALQDPGDTWVVEWRRQRGAVRKQLDRWKEEKAAVNQPTEEMAEAAQKKEQAEQKKRMDQQYQKLIAYLWRMEQEAMKVASQTADQFVARLSRKEKSQLKTSNFHLMAERRQQRDQEWLEQRRRQLLTRQQQQQQQQPKLRRSVSVSRDPQRLLRPTSAYIARLLPVDNQSRPEFYVLDIQSKTVPSWRQS